MIFKKIAADFKAKNRSRRHIIFSLFFSSRLGIDPCLLALTVEQLPRHSQLLMLTFSYFQIK